MIQLCTGVDLVETDRMQGLNPRIRERFIRRVYTQREIDQVRGVDEALIARFAAKEAVSKALGTGIGCVRWQDIEILEKVTGAPFIVLHGRAKEIAAALGLQQWTLSLSHSRSHAVAFVVGWGEIQPEAG
ncbi:MAG TPA: holo-ACP synthase [Anaerolineaceae bacterium]|nr:holo-ACP synthase [Anaerolineaceae bacterium]